MSCFIQIDHQGVPTLAEHRLPNHHRCRQPARYRAMFDLGHRLLAAPVCVEHANEARYPLEVWKQVHGGARVSADFYFVPCVSMYSLPREVYESNLAVSELSALAHA